MAAIGLFLILWAVCSAIAVAAVRAFAALLERWS